MTEFLLQVLVFIYKNFAFNDLGVAIVILTLLVRIILLPFFYKSAKDQTIIQKLQPYIQEIQKNHKGDRVKQGEAMMELYKKHKVNPFSSILLILLQLPIFIALFNLFTKQISSPYFASTYFLGFIDLSKKNIFIVIVAAVFQYLQTKIIFKTQKNNSSKDLNRIMVFVGPLITILIFYNLPSALSLYWLVFSIFSFIQQIYINKKVHIEEPNFSKV